MNNRVDDWSFLKELTHARVSIGRAGCAIPTRELLDFKAAHSRARESVWREVDFSFLVETVAQLGLSMIQVQSRCDSKKEFLLNPDKGRRISEISKKEMLSKFLNEKTCDCLVVIGDGLSAEAIHKNASAFLTGFLNEQKNTGLKVGPVIVARYARVALGDEIGSLFKAKSVLVLIGERPGLATSESLSVYFTYQPTPHKTDAERNCISNIHKNGLSPEGAARMSVYLLEQSLKHQLSGVSLKVEYPSATSDLSRILTFR